MTIRTRTRTNYEPKEPRFQTREYEVALCKNCASVMMYTSYFTLYCAKCESTEVVKVPMSQMVEYQTTFRFVKDAMAKIDQADVYAVEHRIEPFTPAEAEACQLAEMGEWLESDASPKSQTVDVSKNFNGFKATATSEWARRHLNGGE